MALDNSLQQALNLSDQILTAIEQQKLDDISVLDDERRSLIDQYYQKDSSQDIDDKLTLELKQLNDLIVSRLVEMQQNIRSQQINLNQGQKVSRAYLDNT